jgi:hypothetical protein
MSRWLTISFAGDADHFPATMGLTLFVIGATCAKSRRTHGRTRVIESSAYDLAYARIGRGLG